MWEIFYVSNNEDKRFKEVFNGNFTEVIVSGDDLRKLSITLSKCVKINDDDELVWRNVIEIKDVVNVWVSDLYSQISRLINLLCYGINATQRNLHLQLHPELTDEMEQEIRSGLHDRD